MSQSSYQGVVNMLALLCLNVGQVTISGEINFQLESELNANLPVFILTCTSTGGPATTVSWKGGNTMLNATSLSVTNTVTSTYKNTLRVAMREVGAYVCKVSNIRSSDTRRLTVVGED